MKNMIGTIAFFISSMLTFRLIYGAWPPFEGTFREWFASDPRIGWYMLISMVGGIIGTLIVRIFMEIFIRNKNEQINV